MRRLAVLTVAALALVGAFSSTASAYPVVTGYSSGCTHVQVTEWGRDFLLVTDTYRFHSFVEWCWSQGRITKETHHTSVTNVDPLVDYTGTDPSHHGYFLAAQVPWAPSIYAGFVTDERAHFHACIFWACFHENPWIRIRVFAGGAVWVAAGGGYLWRFGP